MKLKLNNSLFFLLFFLLVLAVLIPVSTKSIPSFSGIKPYTVVIDAGHGSPDGGAVGANGTEEKDLNLKVSLKLQEILESRGVKVIMTRSDDTSICDDNAETLHEKKVSDMKKRLGIINNSKADLFLSIHMNSHTSSKPSGLRVFYPRNHPESKDVANKIQNSISKLTKTQSHAVKTASDTLYLMKNPTPPGVLIECGFISNPEEEKLLNDDKYQSKIAFAVADAIKELYN